MYRKLTFASLVVLGLVLAGGTVFAPSRSSTPMIPQTDIAIGLMTEEFPVGDGPTAILSADTHIWVSNFTAGTVTKLRASDGATLGTFKFGNISGLAFDGVTLWTFSLITGVVTRIRPADGFVLGSTVVGTGPKYIAIDSEGGVWVSNSLSDDVTKLSPAGIVLGTFAVGNQPAGILFDGANIWVANSLDSTVTKLSPSTGATLGTFSVGPPGSEPVGLAFDGANVWVANAADNTVAVLDAITGKRRSIVPIAPDGDGPRALAFDGANMWVVNSFSNNVTKLRASDGFNLGSYDVGNGPRGIAFDGANIWVSNFESDSVSKTPASPAAGPDRVPRTMNLQGTLTDPQGDPIDGQIEITFRIYSEESGSLALWGETQSVAARDGRIGLLLGGVVPLIPDIFTGQRWLGIQVGNDPEMAPRLPITSAATSFISERASDLDCDGCVGSAQLALNSVDFSRLADDSVSTSKIQSGAVTSDNLAGNALTTGKIADDSVRASDVAFNYAGSASEGGLSP